jgi:flagellar hook-associated protein 2
MASSVNASTLRLTGMASGMDTESIVKGLMTASKLKVDKAEKQKTLLTWKQEAYKSILTKLNTFQTKYFGTSATSSSSANTLLGSSLSKLGASYSSPYVSVTTSADSNAGSLYVADIVSLASSAKLSGASGVSANPSIAVDTANLGELAGKSMVVTLDGVKKTITFSDKTYSSVQDVRDEMTAQLKTAFGEGKIAVSGSGDDIQLATSNSTLQLSLPTDTTKDPSSVLNFGGYASNRVSLTAAAGSAGLKQDVLGGGDTLAFSINGTDFSFASTTSLGDIMKAVNASAAGVKMSYSSLTDSFTLTSSETGAQSNVQVNDTTGSLMGALFGGATLAQGSDAVVKMSLDGSTNEADMITLTRSSNTFTVDGTQISLLGKASGDAQEGIGITLSYDTDAIATRISSFVTDYNELLKTLTDALSEEVDKDYQPLTEDERADLSEDEIAKWEAKAKSGLLHGDSALSSIASELRSGMGAIVKALAGGDDSMMLASMGLTTGNYAEKGQIHLDTSKLKEALEGDAGKVLRAFTQKSSISYSAYASAEQMQQRFNESGVLWRISDVLSKNLATVGKKGALINLVGSPNSSYTANTDIGKKISSMEARIETMKDKMQDEEDRYWDRFTAMESALSKLQSQNNWLTSMLGGSTN